MQVPFGMGTSAAQMPTSHPFFTSPRPHHLGTELNMVVIVVLLGTSNLLSLFLHLILGQLLLPDASLKLFLKVKQKSSWYGTIIL